MPLYTYWDSAVVQCRAGEYNWQGEQVRKKFWQSSAESSAFWKLVPLQKLNSYITLTEKSKFVNRTAPNWPILGAT